MPLCLLLAAVCFGVLSCSSVAAATDDTPPFVCPPLNPDDIAFIVPLGNLNPKGGHVFPTDHLYFNYGNRSQTRVFAPAAGTVFGVRTQMYGGDKIEIRVDGNRSYYLAHVLLDRRLRVGSQITAGQPLGRISPDTMLDLGACDARLKLPGLLEPARYPSPMLQAAPPLDWFAEPLRSRLAEKVSREGRDKNGKFDFDQPGRLVGNWFHQSLSVKESAQGRSEVWARQLAFVYDVRRPQAVRVSVGGTIAPAGVYEVSGNGPDPASVTVASGSVKFDVSPVDGNREEHPAGIAEALSGRGTLLVQMVADRSLKIEFFSGKRPAEVTGFTAAAQAYSR